MFCRRLRRLTACCHLPTAYSPSVRLLGQRLLDGRFELRSDLGVVADEVADEAPPPVEDEGLRDGVVVGEEEARGLVVGLGELVLDAVELDELGHLRAVFGADDSIPQTFVLDRQGRLVRHFVGYDSEVASELEAAVEQALGEKAD